MGSPPLGSGLRAVSLGHRGHPREWPRHEPPAPRVSRRCPFLRFHQPDCRRTWSQGWGGPGGGTRSGLSPSGALLCCQFLSCPRSSGAPETKRSPMGLLKQSLSRGTNVLPLGDHVFWEQLAARSDSPLRQCFLCLRDFWDAMQRITPCHRAGASLKCLGGPGE